ncbi:DUF1772 domain-containing protein [Nonomuraea cavernae]|uniref:DUF1772 domain-containing protein n=1 Tax=Nonomuraea cavernae TaxID=2045107 RepID=A0A917ZG60_9ACTN|nr:DUF1772 domain-containing protein [Nonomuraea cavernae]MCA2189471.1 DUF1772 domain-containing protein [Nonomuraea cavernae]GGO82171.1 hypothetical protein GCM10012289_72810 [Nonomuraea cavernae]
MISLLVPLSLAGGGLASGVMLSTVIGIEPYTKAMPYDGYVRTIRFLWPRYDPLMPIVNAITFLANAALAVLAPTTGARVTYTTAAALLALVMAISVAKNVPINKYVTSLDPADPPSDWAARDPRAQWRSWNLIRTVLVLTALAASGAGAATLM